MTVPDSSISDTTFTELQFDDSHFGQSPSDTSCASPSKGIPAIRPPYSTATTSLSYMTDAPHSSAYASSTKSIAPTLSTVTADLESVLNQVLSEDELSRDSNFAGFGDLESDEEIDDDTVLEEEQLKNWLAHKKHFLILSSAGKPVYSRYGSEAVIIGYMGIIQAIMGFYQDSNDVLQSFSSDDLNFVIMQQGPLYLCAISKVAESESQLRAQLDALYTQILSALTKNQLTRVFEGRENFDLRRLLDGTQRFLDALSDEMIQGDLAILLSAIQVLRIRQKYRLQIGDILLNHRSPATLYALLATNRKLVSVLRPRQHSLYPADLRLVLNTVFSGAFEVGSEHWIPLCLPKFNSTGFLHVYISFITSATAIVLISADKESFFEMQDSGKAILKALQATTEGKSNILEEINKACTRGLSIHEIGAPQLSHFLYKTRSRVQFVSSSPPLSSSTKVERRAFRVFANLQATSHKHKIQVFTYPDCTALSWVTPTFEVYVIADARCSKAGLVGGANAVLAFVRREEARLFLNDGAMF